MHWPKYFESMRENVKNKSTNRIKNSFTVRGGVLDIHTKCTIENTVNKDKPNLLSLSDILFDLQKEMVPAK